MSIDQSQKVMYKYEKSFGVGKGQQKSYKINKGEILIGSTADKWSIIRDGRGSYFKVKVYTTDNIPELANYSQYKISDLSAILIRINSKNGYVEYCKVEKK